MITGMTLGDTNRLTSTSGLVLPEASVSPLRDAFHAAVRIHAECWYF
jgi:hypothetical protein